MTTNLIAAPIMIELSSTYESHCASEWPFAHSLDYTPRMCNDYGNRIPYAEYIEAFSQIRLPLIIPSAAPNLEPRDEIWPTERAPIIRPLDAGVALEQIPWGLAASRPGAPVVINLRSEGRDFTHGRCLVPASHYFEFTGRRSPKTRWRLTRPDGAWFCFAGMIGRGPEGEAFGLLTVEAGPDVAPVHTRQPAIVERETWAGWLDGSAKASSVLKPSPAGSLEVVESPRH